MDQKEYLDNHKKLLAYVLIYGMYADMEASEVEKNHIISVVGEDVYQEALEVFEGDSDFTILQRIKGTTEHLGYSEEKIDDLLLSMERLFKVDDHYDLLERNLMLGLKKILKTR